VPGSSGARCVRMNDTETLESWKWVEMWRRSTSCWCETGTERWKQNAPRGRFSTSSARQPNWSASMRLRWSAVLPSHCAHQVGSLFTMLRLKLCGRYGCRSTSPARNCCLQVLFWVLQMEQRMEILHKC